MLGTQPGEGLWGRGGKGEAGPLTRPSPEPPPGEEAGGPRKEFCLNFPRHTLSLPKLFADRFIWFLFEERREWDGP